MPTNEPAASNCKAKRGLPVPTATFVWGCNHPSTDSNQVPFSFANPARGGHHRQASVEVFVAIPLHVAER